MNIFDSMKISASGLNSQRAVIGVIAENMANAHTTRTEEGGPYLRKKAILSPSPVPSSPSSPFSLLLGHNMGEEPMGVKVAEEEFCRVAGRTIGVIAWKTPIRGVTL